MGALLLRQSGINFDGRNNKRRNNKDMVDDLLGEFEPSIRSPRVEGVFRAVDRGVYYDKQEGDATDPYGKSPWNPPYSNLHLSSSQIYATVVEGLELRPGMSFLNLGSGSGYLSTLVGLLIGPNGVNHGIELHRDVVDYAYKRLEQFKQTSCAIDKYDFAEPIFICGNFLNFKPSHKYDRVYLGAECLPGALRFVMQLVKPGGGILIMPYEENLMRHVRLSESKWHSESLMNVIFTTMVGLGSHPLVGHDGETQEQRMIEMPARSTRSLRELCRIVIRQQLRRETERDNPELRHSDNLDRRRELRRRNKQRRLRARETELRHMQGECSRCRRESWRNTAGMEGGGGGGEQEPPAQASEAERTSSPAAIRRHLLSRLRTMETGGQGAARRNHYSNRPRPAPRNDRGRLPIDYYGDAGEEEEWYITLRAYPRRLLDRPLGGARPFRDITFEDILSGRPPLSELMRYRPASPSPRPLSPRSMQRALEVEIQDEVEEMMNFASSPSSSSSSDISLLGGLDDDEDDDDDNGTVYSISSTDSKLELHSNDSESNGIIVVDSGDDHDDDDDAERRQVEDARDARLRRMWSEFYRGLEPTGSRHWLAPSEDEQAEEAALRRDREPTRAAADQSPAISRILAPSARNALPRLVSGDIAAYDERQASGSINSTTIHDSSTSGGGPLTRSAARASRLPVQRRAQVAAPVEPPNCPPQSIPTPTTTTTTTSTSMSGDAHHVQRPPSERKRKRQSSSPSSSSSSERDDDDGDDKSSLPSQSSRDHHAATRRRGRSSRRHCTHSTTSPDGHSPSSPSSSLLGPNPGLAGGTSVAIDSRGVMSTMTTRVIMPHGHPGGRAALPPGAPRRQTSGCRHSCGLPPFVVAGGSDVGNGANNNDDNEQVAQIPAASGEVRLPAATEADHSQTGSGRHRRRDCAHRSRHMERRRQLPAQHHHRPPHASATSTGNPAKLSECERYRSYLSASIRRLPLPNVLRDYLNHERDF